MTSQSSDRPSPRRCRWCGTTKGQLHTSDPQRPEQGCYCESDACWLAEFQAAVDQSLDQSFAAGAER
jgi:hypothetical protein